MMEKIISFLLAFFLAIPQLQPMSLYINKLNNESKQTNTETNETLEETTEPEIDQITNENDENPYKIKMNTNLDVEGYGTLTIPSSHFSVVPELSESTRRVLKYKDQKSRLTISYVTNLSSDMDIPGYICKEIAEVDTTTNSKVVDDYGDNEFITVTADKIIDDKQIKVYYSTDKNLETALWMKLEISNDADTAELDAVMSKIMESFIRYYVSNTVFETPTTGIYENMPNDENKGKDTKDYKANSEDDPVHDTKNVGFTKAKIAKDWRKMQVIIDDTKFTLPCSLKTFLNNDFFLNDERAFEKDDDGNQVQAKFVLINNEETTVNILNSKGTVLSVDVINESGSGEKDITDCTVIRAIMDSRKFITPAEAYAIKNNGESGYDEDGGGTGAVHQIILARGVNYEIYVEDLLDTYGGSYSYTPLVGGNNQYEWKDGQNSMTIETGPVRDIVSVTLSTVEKQKEEY